MNRSRRSRFSDRAAFQHHPTLLLIDDDRDQLVIYESLFRQLNCTVVTAGSGREAINVLNDIHVDLVVCDANMPEMNGRDFIRFARGSRNLKNLPIIAFSADPENAEGMLKCGADSFVAKENAQLLREQIQTVLEKVNTSPNLLEAVRERFTPRSLNES